MKNLIFLVALFIGDSNSGSIRACSCEKKRNSRVIIESSGDFLTSQVYDELIDERATIAPFDYCRISRQHTMCKYSDDASTCGRVEKRGLGADEGVKILNALNRIRADMANEELSINSITWMPYVNFLSCLRLFSY